MEEDKSFLGAGWSFPSDFNKDLRSVRMVSGAENSENINSSTLTLIRDTVKRAVLLFEPRIDLENIEIDEERANEGMLYIKLTYTVRATNRKSSLVYPFYFLEDTNIARNSLVVVGRMPIDLFAFSEH